MSTTTVTLPSPNARRGPVRRAVGWISTTATVAAVIVGVLAVVIAIATRFSPRSDYTVFGHPVLTVMSGSMSPTIHTGDLVIDSRISTAEANHLHVGQIITFYAPGSDRVTFTHRIYAVEHVHGSVLYRTKGDRNNTPDDWTIAPSRIVGLFGSTIRFGGYILYALHKPISLILLLASPLLWLLSGWLFSLAREADEQEKARAPTGGEEVTDM